MSRWCALKLSEPRCPTGVTINHKCHQVTVFPLVRWNTRGLVNLTLLETFVVFDLTVYMVVHPSPGTKVEVVRQNEETNGFYITQLPYRLLEIDTRLTATFCFVFASLHQDPLLTCVIR